MMAQVDQTDPLQMLAVGLDQNNKQRESLRKGMEYLVVGSFDQVYDIQFARVDDQGNFLPLDEANLREEGTARYSAVAFAHVALTVDEISPAVVDPKSGGLAAAEASYGLGSSEVQEIAATLAPGEAVAMLMFEHKSAVSIQEAMRRAGADGLSQGYPTPKAVVMVGREADTVGPSERASMTTANADASALLEALASGAGAETVRAAAAAASVLMNTGLVSRGAAHEVVKVLQTAGLVPPTAAKA